MAVAMVVVEQTLRVRTGVEQITGAASVPRRTAFVQGVEQQVTSRRLATARQMALPEVGTLMVAGVVEDQVAEEVVTPDMVKGTRRKMVMNRGILKCCSGKSTLEQSAIERLVRDQVLRRLEEGVTGELEMCRGCKMGRSSEKPHHRKDQQYRAKEQLELVHVNIAGPFSPKSVDKKGVSVQLGSCR